MSRSAGNGDRLYITGSVTGSGAGRGYQRAGRVAKKAISQVVMPREGGASSTPQRRRCTTMGAAAYWDPPLPRVMTALMPCAAALLLVLNSMWHYPHM